MAWETKISQATALKSFLVSVNDCVDIEASVQKFREAVSRQVAESESDDLQTLAAIHTLYDAHPGASLNMAYIKSQTVSIMAKNNKNLNDPRLFSMLSNRVEAVIAVNTNRPAVEAKNGKPAKDAITGRLFSMKRGPAGGLTRDSDQVHDTVRP